MAKVESINEKLLDRYIRHAVYIERFKAGEAKKISRHLNKEVFPGLIDKLMTKVKATDPSKLKKLWVIRRLRRLTASIDKIIKVGMIKAKDATIDSLMDLAEWEAKWNKGMIERMVPLDIDMSMPNPEVLRQAVLTTPFEGHKLGTWFNAYSKSVRIGMIGAVKKGISAGEDIPSIGRRLRKVASLKRMQAEYIARTAVSSVTNGAKEAVFLQNKDLVKEVQYVSTLDTRTTLVCINLDGQIFVVGRGPRPPMHFNCRSTTIPVISSWKEFGIKAPPPATRASMNGKVPAKMTYKTWLRKQNKATQIKVLGKRRAELYRSGRVKIDRFVGKDYKPLTLKQLARREGLEFKPAPPMTVKAMATKGTGLKLTNIEEKAIRTYTTGQYYDIRKFQLGQKLRAKADPIAIQQQIKNMDSGLSKLPGHTGTTYRGLEFDTKAQRAKFLKQFKKGGVWKSKTFQSTSPDSEIAREFAGIDVPGVKPVMMRIEGVSGRDVTKFGKVFGEEEVIFRAGTSFKVIRVTEHSVYLTEITKQAQLKPFVAPPVAPPLQVKAMTTKGTGVKLTNVDVKRIENYTEKNYVNIIAAQLRKIEPTTKAGRIFYKEGLKEAKKLESVLLKLPGWDGSCYRGLRFASKEERINFLKTFREGGVWKSKAFQSTSKIRKVAFEYTLEEYYEKSVFLHIKSHSGRDISKWSLLPAEKEVLFMKGTPFKVMKIKGNEIWLEEITKQVQLKPVIVPPVATVSKVGTTYAKTTSAEIRKVVDETINAYPEKVKVVFNRNGVSYNIGNSLTEINPVLKGKHPTGWSKGTTWDNVSGVYDIETKTISVAETYLPKGKKLFAANSKDRIKRVLNHETGHGFDEWSKGFFYSDTDTFQAAYARDIAKLSKTDIVKNNLRFFLQEGARGRSETFADIFGDIMGGGGVPEISKFFPNSTEYVKGILK